MNAVQPGAAAHGTKPSCICRPFKRASRAEPDCCAAPCVQDGPGAAKSTDDLGPAFGDDLTATEVGYLMTTEFVRPAGLLRHSTLARMVPARHRAAPAAFRAA
jgi:hypothetical protein